jgi:hypothetical protein
MSLNFDVISNLSPVRRFHTRKKIVKMCQFYSDSSRFFATNCIHIQKRENNTFPGNLQNN